MEAEAIGSPPAVRPEEVGVEMTPEAGAVVPGQGRRLVAVVRRRRDQDQAPRADESES